jgi:triacylglycerol lipase
MLSMPIRVLCIAACTAALALAVPARGADGPALETQPAALEAALTCPQTFDDRTGEPVLLVHGTFSTDDQNWGWNYVPALESLGFDVCTVLLPDKSLGDIQVQTEYVVHAIRAIAGRSGDQVDVAGASQGTLQPRWAVKWWPDVRTMADDLVLLAGPHHGTSFAGNNLFGRCFESCWQMRPGSAFLTALNAGDETPGDISYTSVFTTFDELVQPQLPTSTSALDGAANIRVQDVCPARPADHVTLSTTDAVGFALALDAFTHAGPADPARIDPAVCLQAIAPGMQPLSLLQSGFGGWPRTGWSTSEPPLKPYAR